MMVRCWGIRAPQQPPSGPLDNTCFSMWDVGGGEAASWQPQRPNGTSKGTTGGTPSDCHRKTWADRPGTIIHATTEVPRGGELDMADVERRETYLGTGGLTTRDETTIFLQCGH